MKTPIFKGNTDECLRHAGSAKFNNDVARFIAEFVGVQYKTARRWLRGERFPSGDILLKLRYVLEFIGYQVSELDSLKPEIKACSRLIAFGLINADEMVNELGFKLRHTLFSILHNRERTTKDRLRKMSELGIAFNDMLEESKREKTVPRFLGIAEEINADVPEITPEPEVEETKVDVPEVMPEVYDNDQVVRILSYFIRSMIPLVELSLSDLFTVEERKQIRFKSGRDGVFRLSNLLNGLCGEKARDQF